MNAVTEYCIMLETAISVAGSIVGDMPMAVAGLLGALMIYAMNRSFEVCRR